MSLRDRLENVTERAVLLQIIKDVTNDPQNNQQAVLIFCESIDCFSKFLTDKEYTTVLAPAIQNLCPMKSMLGFADGLPRVSSRECLATFRDVMTVLGWLKQMAETKLPRVICDSLKVPETDAETTQFYRDFVKAAMSISDKVSNCCVKALTEDHVKYIETIKWSFKKTIFQGIQKALEIAHDKPSSNLKTVSELMSAGRNMEMASRHVLLVNMMEWIGSIEDFDDRWMEILDFLFQKPTVLGVQVHEALLTSLFLSAKNERTLMRCIRPSTLTGTLKRVVMVKLPFQRVLKPKIIRIVLNFVYKAGEAYAMELLQTAIKIWADPNFAKRTPEAQERHLVRVIVYSIYLFKNSTSEIPWNDLFLVSMNGVHSRMGMLPVYVQSALFINFTLSKIAIKDQEAPSAPEFDASPWTEELEAIMDHGIEKRRKRSEVVAKEDSDDEDFVEQIGERALPIVDREEVLLNQGPMVRRGSLGSLASGVSLESGPRAPFGVHGDVGQQWSREMSEASEEEEEEPSTSAQRLQNSSPILQNPRNLIPIDSDDDEDFPDYQVEETEKKFKNLEIGEEPKSKATPPSYIADAFEMLLEKEKYEVFESAFFNLKDMINRRAIGFPAIAEKLFVRIIYLQNVFGTKDFDEIGDEIATACITQRPEIVPALVRLLIAPRQSKPIQQRLLKCIHKAADEMGALDERNEEFVTRQELKIGGMTLNRVSPDEDEEFDMIDGLELRIPEARLEAEVRIRANTRRIGGGRERPRAGVVNRLAKAAKYMFYPLLVLPRGENARLLGDDSDILAYIIMVASMVYVRCGVNPAVAKMTTELISYASPHRYSENPKLRTACMAAYLNVFALIPGNMLAELFPVEMRQEWLQWIESTQLNSSREEMEYGMGYQLHRLISENLEEYNPVNFYQSRYTGF